MNPTLLSRIGLSGLVAIAVAFAGCDETPKFDPAIQYSADTLAQEFVYEYGELKQVNGSAARGVVATERPRDVAKGATKTAGTTKNEPAASLDELIAQTLRKADHITGMQKSDACRKVVELVEKTSSIPDADKKIIKEKLGSTAD